MTVGHDQPLWLPLVYKLYWDQKFSNIQDNINLFLNHALLKQVIHRVYRQDKFELTLDYLSLVPPFQL